MLAAEWPERALIRAQLIEEGLEVVRTDTWPMMRRYLRPGIKPPLAFVDLHGLPDPAQVLDDLAVLMKPQRVLVLVAIGTLSAAEIDRRGFHVLSRPVAISAIVQAIKSLHHRAAGAAALVIW